MKTLRQTLIWPLTALIGGYQLTLGRVLAPSCRFYPSCSNYALQSLRLNGPVIGMLQAIWRILRCGPWSDGGIDEPNRIRFMRRPNRHHDHSTASQ